MTEPFVKDPYDKEDFGVDYSGWMAEGDSIASSTWSYAPDDGALTLSSSVYENTGFTTTIFAEGGTVMTDYELINQIVTTGGRKKQRSIKLLVRTQ